MADLRQIRYQLPDGSYTDALRTHADASGLVDRLPAGATRRILDALGRTICEIDEATGAVTRTRHDAGADGPRHTLVHDSPSPAADDVIGSLVFRSRNDAGALFTGVELRALAKSVAAGAEEVWFEAGVVKAGVFVASGLSLRVVGGALRLYVDGAEVGAGGGGSGIGPHVHARRGTTQAIAQNTETALQFTTTVEEDVAGMHDPVTNNSRLVAKQAGRYYFYGTAEFAGTSSLAGQFFGACLKNGSAGNYLDIDNKSHTATIRTVRVAGYARLAIDDFIEFLVYQNVQASLNVLTRNSTLPFFGMTKIGD